MSPGQSVVLSNFFLGHVRQAILNPHLHCSKGCHYSLQAHIDLKIPKEHHRFVIGREGQKLKTIELQTATKISVPRTEDNTNVIRIVGTREGVDKARHQVQLISDEQVRGREGRGGEGREGGEGRGGEGREGGRPQSCEWV